MEIGAFSISLAHTGSMPQHTAANGNTPIPSNRLPSRSAVILSAPLSLDGQNALKGGGGDPQPLGNGDVVLHGLGDGMTAHHQHMRAAEQVAPHVDAALMLLGNGVIEEKRLIERRADRRKACLIHRAAILRCQLCVFMELVRHTVEFIKRKPYGNKLLIKVKDEVKLVIDATSEYEPCDRQKIIEQNKKNTVRHAYFREYLALQRLCLLILQHQKHQIGAGARQIYGILFDGAWLWEEYVNSLIEDVFYHPMNKGGKGAQRLFDGNVGLIYPDFISRNSETRIIADAKYKPVDNIGNRDYLQVLAYMFRFDAKTGYYLYPEAEGSDDLKLRMNCGSTYEKNVMPRDDISLTKHGLKIPVDALNYAEFSVRMKTCEQEFKSALIF